MNTKNTKVKTVNKSETVSESKPVEQVAPVEQVVDKPVQKGGKKSSKSVELVEPVKQVETVAQVAPVVEKPAQKGGKKSSKTVEPVVPVEEVKAVESVQKQKGGKKSSKQVVLTDPIDPVVPVDQVQTAGKVEVDELDEDDEPQMANKLRYFKLIYNNEIQGRYCGKKPKQAANKAFSSIIKDMKKGGNQEGGANMGVNMDINFTIRECTRNSKHKEYKYVGIRETLKEPVKVSINNEDGSVKEIIYNFHNKIQKAPKA